MSDLFRIDPAMPVKDLLARYPGVARRSAQRWLGQLVEQGRIAPQGAARARRYVAIKAYMAASPPPPAYRQDSFPDPWAPRGWHAGLVQPG